MEENQLENVMWKVVVILSRPQCVKFAENEAGHLKTIETPCQVTASLLKIMLATQSKAWWHHQMESFSMLQTLCEGNSPVTSDFPSQRPVMRSFDVFFDLRLSKWLSEQLRCWWFEMPSRSLWCHCISIETIDRQLLLLNQNQPNVICTWFLDLNLGHYHWEKLNPKKTKKVACWQPSNLFST